MSSDLLSRDENNLERDIVEAFKLLYSPRVYQPSDPLDYERRLVSICKNIFKSERTTHVFFYFCRHGAATAQVLQVQLSMNYQVTYRVLRVLFEMGIIHKVRRIRDYARQSKGGRRFQVWGLMGVEKEDVARSITLHRRCMSPKYRMAEEIVPTILDEYIHRRNVDSVTKSELIQFVRENKLSSYNVNDVVELAIPLLNSRGVKVWR